MDELVKVEGVSHYYGPHCALNDIHFTVKPGEVLGLLGLNGAGKTTCLRILSGNLAPSCGRIWIQGHDIEQQPLAGKQRLGYLPERPPLYPDLRVDEYLEFCGRIRRLGRSSLSKAVARIKAQCGLTRVGRRLIGKLSKGYQQRIGIAQALLHKPSVIILDEPTEGLDPVQIRTVRELVRELAEARGVILASHLLAEVQAVCSHVLILHQGSVAYRNGLRPASETPSGTCLRIHLAFPPSLEQLTRIAGAQSVEQLSTGQFELRIRPDAAIPEVAQRLVESGWGLRELTQQRHNLEQVFLDIVSGTETP
jgi:ABC-2 type transport system ATP-binding protein